MNDGANAPKLEQQRRVGFCEFRFDTPQLAAGGFILSNESGSRPAKNEIHMGYEDLFDSGSIPSEFSDWTSSVSPRVP